MPKVKNISQENVTDQDFRTEDFPLIAQHVRDEWNRRRNDSVRKDMEKQWDEIERQLRMEPSMRHKIDNRGKTIDELAWMAEMELPLQSQTLEMLTADSRRMKFPPIGYWFRGRAAMTDEYMQRFEQLPSPTGSGEDPPSRVQQDVGDRLAEGLLHYWHSQYDFEGVYDQIDAEAFTYGTGIGRLKRATKMVMANTERGSMPKEQTFPVLVAQRLRNTYLDDRVQAMTAEGHMVGPMHIYERTQKLSDLRLAAAAGSPDLEDEQSGGWIGGQLSNLQADRDDLVTTLEAEGDVLVARSDNSTIFIPNVIINVAIGHSDGGRAGAAVYRFRFKESPFNSYIIHPYHVTAADTIYATSPLMMGWPLQDAAAQALNRVIDSGLLNTLPPLNYDPDDPEFAQKGPSVFPGAQWASVNGVKAEQIGDPSTLMSAYRELVQHYFDVTGVNQPRLGQQTVSHTTAFAKDAELSRGVIRTADYVRSSMKGPMQRLLFMEYQMGLSMLGSKQELSYFIEPWNEFVHIQKGHLPDTVFWQAHGSGGPASEDAEKQERIASLQMALQLDAAAQQQGREPTIDLPAAIRQILSQGGWQDISFLADTGGQLGPEALEGMGGGMPGFISQGPGGAGGAR